MPMRRAIGISIACLVTSACATSEILEESKSHDPVGTPTSIADPGFTLVRRFQGQ